MVVKVEINNEKFDKARHELLDTAQFLARKVEEAEKDLQAVFNALETLKNVLLRDLSLHGQNLLDSINIDNKEANESTKT